jgi:hypothetical protein
MAVRKRAFLAGPGAPPAGRPGRPGWTPPRTRIGRRRGSGRHRKGGPGLRYCREIPAVRSRLAVRSRRAVGSRPAMRLPSAMRSPSATPPGVTVAMLVILAGAAALSAWLAGAGATAFADIIRR